MRHSLVARWVGLFGLSLLRLASLAADEPAAPLPEPAAVQPPTSLEYHTDFQSDCRAEFQSTGTVDWQPGQLTLQPGATIRKEVNGNWHAEWQFDLAVAASEASTQRSDRGWSSQLHWQVTMEQGCTPWRLTWKQTGLTAWQITLSDLQPQLGLFAKTTTIRQIDFGQPLDGKWYIDYNAGLVQVRHNEQLILAGYLENDLTNVIAGQWRTTGTKLHVRGWQQRTALPAASTEAHQQDWAQATQLKKTGLAAFRQGKFSEAEPYLRRALALQEQCLGNEHLQTASTGNNLALLFHFQGNYAEAEPLYQRSLASYEQHLGETHPQTSQILNNLAGLYEAQAKYSAAETMYRRALAIRE